MLIVITINYNYVKCNYGMFNDVKCNYGMFNDLKSNYGMFNDVKSNYGNSTHYGMCYLCQVRYLWQICYVKCSVIIVNVFIAKVLWQIKLCYHYNFYPT